MAQHGKRYRDSRASFEREQVYSPVEAVRLLKAMGATKFDETVELHFRLGLNVRHADEQLRGTLMLPHGSGKDVRVAVFAVRAKPSAAKGRYIRQITLTSTMGPGIHVDPARIRGIVEELDDAPQEAATVPA